MRAAVAYLLELIADVEVKEDLLAEVLRRHVRHREGAHVVLACRLPSRLGALLVLRIQFSETLPQCF